MRTKTLTTLVVLSLTFFGQATAGVIERRQETVPEEPVPQESVPPEPELIVPQRDELDGLAQVAVDNVVSSGALPSETPSETSSEKMKRFFGGQCSIFNIAIRREWDSLSKPERKEYIDAVLCLTKKPSKSNPTEVPGARSRYDDFVAVHIQQTLSIHGTANFLSWHRYYIWAFEQALRNECGYTGYLPYWNWGRHATNPEASPVFDGSAWSMSGNGVFVPGRNNSAVGGGAISIPPGNGGGCLKNGPFKDMKVNLGPLSTTVQGVAPNPQANGLGYNPRCIKRDIGSYATSHWTKTQHILDLILNFGNIKSFQERLQGDFPNGFLGAHSAGHFTIAGDPGGDIFASPGDPAFWLHHGMVDRVWWIWQNLDVWSRVQSVAGTITINNRPPSRNGTLEDTCNLGVIAPNNVKLKDLMSTVDGPFCYIYL